NGWQIYENKNVLPRINMFGDYNVITDKNLIIHKLYDSNFDLKNTLVLEETPENLNVQPDESARVRVLSYKPNVIGFATKSDKDQLLFISDNFFPGWNAKVDGTSVPIYRADYTFRAVP